jgi:hypothetical protein
MLTDCQTIGRFVMWARTFSSYIKNRATLRYIVFALLSVFLVCSSSVSAQHHEMDHDTTRHTAHSDRDVAQLHDMGSVPMSHAFSLNLSMNRNASGTAWLPDEAPMYGYMLHSKKWMYMIHGNVFLRYNSQDVGNKGLRGDAKVDAPNWFMGMGQRRVGNSGLFRFSAMLSLDPLFGGEGYPLLFQTGETYQGQPLVDRQHPHNLFSELSIGYTESFSKDADAFVYVAYPGEPALAPVAFMHRPSSFNITDSPLGHHWQDATHITFGVATLGFRYKIFKVDGSVFTGREPGEARYGFDRPRFDSYSYRLTANPSRQLSLQFSKAFIKSPEAVDPDEDVNRTTASVIHALPLGAENRSLNSAFIWGYNDSGEDHQENSFTLESNLQLDRFAVYGRYEHIEKSAEELLLEQFEAHELFEIKALTMGVNYTIFTEWETNFSLGVQGSLYEAESELDPIYGNNPVSLQVYMRINPTLMLTESK